MINKFLAFFKDMPAEKNRFGLRVLLAIIGVIVQGCGVYWLTQIKFGTDPCTVTNLGISYHIGLSYGTTLLIFNCILFLVLIRFDIKRIGIGTLANMVLVGYSADFTGWVMSHFLPEGFFDAFSTRVIILFPGLLIMIFGAAMYMAVDLGQSPYDAIPFIITNKSKLPFLAVRIGWDAAFTIIGFFLGGTVGVVTVLIALFLGPVITLVKNWFTKIFGFK